MGPWLVDAIAGNCICGETEKVMMGVNRSFLLSLLSAVTVLLAFFPSAAPGAPQPDPAARPRIGLVLSGGGARGAAHIGVIRVLEEMRIPVDVIAGTSMGAIVGGLYASGMSAERIENLVKSVEWGDVFRDTPPLQDLSFRRKQDYESYPIKLAMGFAKGKFKAPLGIIQGQNLSLLLKSLLVPVAAVRDFDKLPIPFRAVAADIETGDAVVLRSGDLATAIHASMAVPGVLAPVEIDGRLLVDGGVSDNIPVNVAREMGADLLIVVDVGTPLRSRDKIDSVVDITAQLVTIMIRRNSAEQLKTLSGADILITPSLGDIGTGDFLRAPEAALIGKKQAERMAQQLAKLSLSEKDFKTALARQRREAAAAPMIDFVEVKNKSPLSNDVIESRVRLKPGDRLDTEALKKDLNSIYGLGLFESVDYNLVEKDGKTGLVVKAEEKSWGTDLIRFGFNLSDDFKGTATYNLGLSYTKTAVNSRGGEWRNEAQIGDRPRFFSEFYQPLESSLNYFIAPRVEYRERNINAFNSAGNIVTQYRVSTAEAGLDVGRDFGNWGELRLGVRRSHGKVDVRIGDPSIQSYSFDNGGLYSAFAYNTFDNVNFPLRGASGNIELSFPRKELSSDINAKLLRANLHKVYTWDDNTIVPGFTVQTVLDSEVPIQDTFPLGGFLNLSGYAQDELSGQNTGLARLVYYRRIAGTRLPAFNMPIYLGGSLEAGNAWNSRSDINYHSLIYAGSVFLGADTYLGPMYIGYGQAEGGRRSIYLSIGQTF